MNNAPHGRKALTELRHEDLQNYIADPQNSTVPEYLQPQLKRVLQVARLLDDYPNDSHIINIMLAKYNISRSQIKKDIALAREMFKTQHTFDWDFWFAWMLKDQIELIRKCKLTNNLKEWNNAKKVLREMIGERPEAIEDPRRMEKNIINIQVNNLGQVCNLPLDKIKGLSTEDREVLVQSMFPTIDEAQAEEIMNT